MKSSQKKYSALKIGFDGKFLNIKNTGIHTYCLNLLENLVKNDAIGKILVVCKDMPSNKIRKSLSNEKIQIVVKKESKILNRISTGLANLIWEKSIFKVFKKFKVDLVHIPYASSYKYSKIPIIFTIHDVIPWKLEQYR